MSAQKNILVTGVSRGLGLEIGKQLLEQGHSIRGVCRNETNELTELQHAFPNALRVGHFDQAKSSAIREQLFSSEFLSLDTPLDGVVNNAGIAYDEIITNYQEEPLAQMIQVNLTAPMLICREAIRNMLLHKRRGAFVHISSVCAHTGYKGLAAYAATKAGLEAFSRTLAREWGERGIRSNCVAAGFMETDMSAGLDDAQRESIFRRTSLKQPTDPGSVAATVAYLLSDEAASITRSTVAVDSGTV